MIREEALKILKNHEREIRKLKVKKLSIFGSVARNQESLQSDIDILVKFDSPATFDLYMDLKFFLEDLLKRKVDLVTEEALREEIKEYIERDLIRVA